MINVDLGCPPHRWPVDFSECIAIGITEARDDVALWVVLRFERGKLIETLGIFSSGRSMPSEVQQMHPIVYAIGDKQLWMLMSENREMFYKKVADAKLHVGGDFRQFGRLTGRLIRLAENTRLWCDLEHIIDSVARGRSR